MNLLEQSSDSHNGSLPMQPQTHFTLDNAFANANRKNMQRYLANPSRNQLSIALDLIINKFLPNKLALITQITTMDAKKLHKEAKEILNTLTYRFNLMASNPELNAQLPAISGPINRLLIAAIMHLNAEAILMKKHKVVTLSLRKERSAIAC